MPRIAIFTDNDFRKTNGLTTTLKAVLRFSTEFEVRVFTAEDEPVDRPEYLAIPGPGTTAVVPRDARVLATRQAVHRGQGGPRSHVRPGETGFVCPADSVEAFADAITVLARDLALRRAMSAHARAYTLTQSWTASLMPLHDGWRSAMRSSGTGPDQSRSTRRQAAATEPA